MMKAALITLVVVSTICLSAFCVVAQEITGQDSAKINLIMVGYDIEDDQEAQDMLNEMAEAVKASGAHSEVIMSGKDRAQLEEAMERAVTSAVAAPAPPPPPPPPPAKPELHIKSSVIVGAGEEIVVVHTGCPAQGRDANAWIGFYKATDPHNEYVSYTFLNNLMDDTYDIEAPDEPGPYNFRLFLDEGYTPAAISNLVEVGR